MHHTSLTGAQLATAALKAAAIPATALLLSSIAFAQDAASQPPPIDILVTAFFGVETTDDCLSRVRLGFDKAGYANITQPSADVIAGVMLNGDNAGVSSTVQCFTGGQISLGLASAGTSSLGDVAPQTQNSRLLNAIIH